MAVDDLIVGVSGMIHIVLEDWFLVSGNNENTVFCGRLNEITFFSTSISIYTMAILAYDRFMTDRRCIALLGKVFKRTIHGLYNHSTSMTKQRIVG